MTAFARQQAAASLRDALEWFSTASRRNRQIFWHLIAIGLESAKRMRPRAQSSISRLNSINCQIANEASNLLDPWSKLLKRLRRLHSYHDKREGGAHGQTEIQGFCRKRKGSNANMILRVLKREAANSSVPKHFPRRASNNGETKCKEAFQVDDSQSILHTMDCLLNESKRGFQFLYRLETREVQNSQSEKAECSRRYRT